MEKAVKITSYYGGEVYYCGTDYVRFNECLQAALTLGIALIIEFIPKDVEK